MVDERTMGPERRRWGWWGQPLDAGVGDARPADPSATLSEQHTGVHAAPRARHAQRGLPVLLSILGVLLVVFVVRSLAPVPHPAAATAVKVRVADAAQRVRAVQELAWVGPEDPEVALPALTDRLKDAEPAVRAAAAKALVMVIRSATHGGSASPNVKRAIHALFEGLNDHQAEARSAAVEALWMTAITSETPPALLDLNRIGQVLRTAAADPEPAVRLSALHGLGAVGPRLADEPDGVLLDALGDVSALHRAAAVEALVRFRAGLPRVLPALVAAFEKAAPEHRAGYAAVLERMRPTAFDARVVPALAGALESSDAEIRYLAAESLGALRRAAKPAVPALLRCLCRQEHLASANPTGDGARDPALAAGQTLVKVMPDWHDDAALRPALDADTFAALVQVLRSGRPEVRAVTATVLGRARPMPEVLPVLAESVRDPDPNVRAAALQALHDIGNHMPFVPPQALHAALEDESAQVRFWAAGALGHAGLALDEFLPALIRHAEQDADAEVRAVCADEIGNFIRREAVTVSVIPMLLDALASSSSQMRCAACSMLGRFGREASPAVPAILRVLERGLREPGERSPSIMAERSRAVAALGTIAPGTPHAPAAVAALVNWLDADPKAAGTMDLIEALARFGPVAKSALPGLRALARDGNESVREAARKSLASIEVEP